MANNRDRAEGGEPDIKSCEYCSYELATLQLSPCEHMFCDDCANTRLCPTCSVPVENRERFAAPMPVPGREDADGVDAVSLTLGVVSLTLDERIVKLQAGARAGKVHSFRLKEHAVAEPSGIPNPQLESREWR